MGFVAASVLRAAKGEPYFGTKRWTVFLFRRIKRIVFWDFTVEQRKGWGGGGSLGMHGGVCVSRVNHRRQSRVNHRLLRTQGAGGGDGFGALRASDGVWGVL